MFWRVLLLNMLLMFVNYIDRTNLSFGSIQMNSDLNISPSQYGLGAGLFFLSYASMGIPAQIMMTRVGGPKWLGTIALGWGIVAACFALVRSIPAFLALRCLLGFFESGALPGMWTYLTYFYNKNRITVPMGYLMTALILSQALGAPLAAGLMAMDGLGGLRGWQWLFLIEGLLAIVVAVAFFFMPAGVDQVKGLTEDERAAVHASMAAYVKPQAAVGPALKAAVQNPAVWVLGSAKFCRDVAFYGLMYWLPLFVKLLLSTPSNPTPAAAPTILLCMVPYAASAVANLLNSMHSRRSNERRWHVTACWAFGAVALAVLPACTAGEAVQQHGTTVAAAFVVLSLAVVGVYGAEGTSIAYYMACMGGEKGIGIAVINTVSSLGGFAGPYLLGALRQSTGNFQVAMGVLAACLGVAAIVLGSTNEQWASKYVLNKVTPGSADSSKQEQQQQTMQDVEASTAGFTDASADAYVLTVPQTVTRSGSKQGMQEFEGLDGEERKDAKAGINGGNYGPTAAGAAAGGVGSKRGENHC